MDSGPARSPVRVVGYAAAGWCIGFASVSAWQVAASLLGHPAEGQRYAAYASGLAIVGVLVGVLKLAGAAVALAAVLVQPGRSRRSLRLLGAALWGAFGLLGLYSAGNLFITVGTVSRLLAPSAAWTAAGGYRDPGPVGLAAHLNGCGPCTSASPERRLNPTSANVR